MQTKNTWEDFLRGFYFHTSTNIRLNHPVPTLYVSNYLFVLYVCIICIIVSSIWQTFSSHLFFPAFSELFFDGCVNCPICLKQTGGHID